MWFTEPPQEPKVDRWELVRTRQGRYLVARLHVVTVILIHVAIAHVLIIRYSVANHRSNMRISS
jgi:hypothetical protein